MFEINFKTICFLIYIGEGSECVSFLGNECNVPTVAKGSLKTVHSFYCCNPNADTFDYLWSSLKT